MFTGKACETEVDQYLRWFESNGTLPFPKCCPVCSKQFKTPRSYSDLPVYQNPYRCGACSAQEQSLCCLFRFYSTSRLLKSVPDHLSVEEISQSIEGIPGVEAVAHLHVWPIDERMTSIEVRIAMRDDAELCEADELRLRLRSHLETDFGIGHITIEVLPKSRLEGEPLITPH